MHGVFVDTPLPEGSVFAPVAKEAEHLFKVLRARVGDQVALLDGCGWRGEAVVVDGKNLRVTASTSVPEPTEKIYLYCALPRRQKFDVLLKQAAELGVWEIVPVNFTRSVSDGYSPERWSVLLREGCKQSGNPFVPRLGQSVDLPQAIRRAEESGARLFYGAIGADTASMQITQSTAWFVGPEGGFTAEEEELLRGHSEPLNLGPHILRLETAAICGVAVLRSLMKRAALLLPLLACLWLLVGCSPTPIRKNPLARRAEVCLKNGDTETARQLLERLVAKFPDSSHSHLLLANLLDEQFGDCGGAMVHYDIALRLTDAENPERKNIEKMYSYARRKFIEAVKNETNPLQAENERLKAENAKLREQILIFSGHFRRQNQLIADLKRQVNAAPRRYVVKAGDSPRKIANKFNVSLKAFLELNKLDSGKLLRQGQVVLIPENK